jgi:hypothetical protein
VLVTQLRESGIAFSLPDDAIVIQLDFPLQFAFICSSEGDDPHVYYFAWLPREMTVTVTNVHGTETKTIKAAYTSPPRTVQLKRFSEWITEYMIGLEEKRSNG